MLSISLATGIFNIHFTIRRKNHHSAAPSSLGWIRRPRRRDGVGAKALRPRARTAFKPTPFGERSPNACRSERLRLSPPLVRSATDLNNRIVQGNAVRTKAKTLHNSHLSEELPGERCSWCRCSHRTRRTRRASWGGGARRISAHERISGNRHQRPERSRTQRNRRTPHNAQKVDQLVERML